MKRKITNELTKWKIDSNKKPLLLFGISGCGKTYSIINFGNEEYKNTIYFDCCNNIELNYVFEKNTTIDKLIRSLSALSLETIFKEESLIIFDNVTSKILNYIKPLFAGNSLYHVICITNDAKLIKKYKTDFAIKKMNLVDFEEYLRYVGKEQLITFIEDSFKSDKHMPFHNMAIELYNDFVITGGYPNAICVFNETKNSYLLSAELQKNLKIFQNKLLQFDNYIDAKRSENVLDNISIQMIKNNKKFMYGTIKQGARAKEYSSSIEFLEVNDMIIKASRISEIKAPLSKIKDEENFKLYYNDSGFLYKKLNVGLNRLLTNDKLLYLLYKNNVASTLHQNGFNLYNYHSDGKAEIDFVIQTRTGKVLTIEMIENSSSSKSKSLSIAMGRYKIDESIRIYDGNFKVKNGIKYIPYYATFCIKEVM